MDNFWVELWSASLAAQHLLLDGKQLRVDTVLASRLKNGVDAWFNGAKGALNQDEYLRERAPNLPQVLAKIEHFIRKVNGNLDVRLPPALWLRLFNKLEIPFPPQPLIDLARWQFSNEAKGKHYLFKYWDEGKEAHIGPKHEPTGKYGRTVLELLSGEFPAKIGNQPYALEWIVELHTSIRKDKDAHKATQSQVKLTKSNLQIGKESKTKTIAASKQRKRRNINSLRTLYGTGCVDAVQEALEDYVERRQSNILSGSSDNRPYSTSFSAVELIEFLQKKYQLVGRYSISTLKPVLSHFVYTPRGRPPTLAERTEKQRLKLKSLRPKSQ